MGIAPDGEIAHNGLDHWWDDEGEGNCWEGNTYSRGERTDNFTVDPASCADGGSTFTPGAPVKDAGFLSCSQYDRSDPTFRHPPGCEWFDGPTKPDESGASGATVQDDDADLLAAPLVALTGLLFFVGIGRRRRVRGAA
jgi:hypothetical protein